jgi:hypothetical protein
MFEADAKGRLLNVGKAVFGLLLAAAMLVVAVPWLTDALRVVLSNDSQVEGVASEVRESCGGGVCSRYAVVKYAVSGVDYAKEMNVARDVYDGDLVNVSYDPAHPDKAVALTGRTLWIGTATTLMGLFFLGLGLRSLRSAIRGDRP